MMVGVRLFALARDLAGRETIDVELPPAATVGDLRAALAKQYPPLAGILRVCLLAVNADYAGEEVLLAPADDVALIPPVSGG
jgi:molybdopterin converting factor subunit 1